MKFELIFRKAFVSIAAIMSLAITAFFVYQIVSSDLPFWIKVFILGGF